MHYCDYITRKKMTICSTCYWNEDFWQSDMNVDNKEEILELVEVRKKLYPATQSYFSNQ